MNNASSKDNKLNTRKIVHAQKRFDIESENINHYHKEKKKILSETRKLLAISFMSILLCLFALTGTTYAWFTSTVSNSNNLIQAGNLNIGFLAEDTNQQIIDLSSNNGSVFNVESLMPENPIKTVLTVQNKGTVDLKFAIFFNITKDFSIENNENTKLSKMLKVYVKEYDSENLDMPENPIGTMADFAGTSGFISEDKLPAGKQKKYCVWIDLDSSAAPATYKDQQIEFDIRLNAKQIEDTSNLTNNTQESND